MTYETESKKAVRVPVRIVEIDLPYCLNTLGTAPCTSLQTGDSKCFNSRCLGSNDCGDVTNFNAGVKTYRFCEDIGLDIPGAIPCIPQGSINITQPKLPYLGGLGTRSVASIKLKDFTWADLGIDKYLSDRTYDPSEQGTYFGKLRARNPFYRGATARILDGFWTEDFSLDNFTTMYFIFDKFNGPSGGSKSEVTFTFKDILIKSFGGESVYPKPGTAKIATAVLDTGLGTVTVDAGTAAGYPTSFYGNIGTEVLSLTYPGSGDVFTLVARSLFGTEAEEHDIGAIIQVGLWYDAWNVMDVFKNILQYGCNIPLANIDTTDIDYEKNNWYEVAPVTRYIGLPMPCDEMLDRLGITSAFNMWTDISSGKVRCRAIRPTQETITTYSDDYNLIAETASTEDSTNDRVTTVIVWYGLRNPVESDTETKNYYAWSAWSDDEYKTLYGDEDRVKNVFAPWLTRDQHLEATSLANSIIARSKLTPSVVRFDLDAKDGVGIELGAPIRVESKINQTPTGVANTKALQVLGKTAINKKNKLSHFSITAMDYQFDARLFILMDTADEPDYEDSSEDEKDRGGYLCDDSDVFPVSGDAGYKLS